MKSLHRETKWPFCMISTLGWRKLSTCLHCGTYIWELSYKVAKLFHQHIVSIWKIAGIDSTNAASARFGR
jgi:hypothetical protein